MLCEDDTEVVSEVVFAGRKKILMRWSAIFVDGKNEVRPPQVEIQTCYASLASKKQVSMSFRGL